MQLQETVAEYQDEMDDLEEQLRRAGVARTPKTPDSPVSRRALALTTKYSSKQGQKKHANFGCLTVNSGCSRLPPTSPLYIHWLIKCIAKSM